MGVRHTEQAESDRWGAFNVRSMTEDRSTSVLESQSWRLAWGIEVVLEVGRIGNRILACDRVYGEE